MRFSFLLASALIFSTPAAADILVRFDEGAPKDRFTITNTGNCALPLTSVTIDLTGSAAGLIFDVTGSGAGVSVFQPFQLVLGGEHVSTLPQVKDGDRAVSLKLKGFWNNPAAPISSDCPATKP